MTIQNLTQEIFEKSFSRESLERLLTKEIKVIIEKALWKMYSNDFQKETSEEQVINRIVKETLKSE